MVEFLNTTFRNFDGGMFSAMHGLAQGAGGFFTPVFKAITLLGEKGLLFMLIGFVLLFFARTRKIGVCMLGAIAIGAIITNVTLKPLVARPRPYTDPEFIGFWEFVGKPTESDLSFPSGHTTAITAFMTAMFIMCNKKWSWVGFIGVILMGLSRIYLVAHYTTDVIAGLLVGGIAGVCAFFITKLIYKIINKHKEKKFCKFVLEFDIIKFFKKDKIEQETEQKGKEE